MKWFKNTQGEESATLTFAIIAFTVTTINYAFSIFPKLWGLETRPFDSGSCAAYLTPILTLYFSRRFTASKQNTPVTSKVESQNETTTL